MVEKSLNIHSFSANYIRGQVMSHITQARKRCCLWDLSYFDPLLRVSLSLFCMSIIYLTFVIA
jgi:hypothetical protein